jgi:hypothetical protein
MSDAHREYCRRQHRIIAHHLAIQAWLRGLDCIVLVREDLEQLFDLHRFKSARVGWLQEDMRPWFPHQEAYYRSGADSSIHSLFLSRVPVDDFLPSGTMTTEKRIAGMAPNSPKTARFSEDGKEHKAPSDADIVAHLALLAAGLEPPRRLGRTKRKRIS